MGHSARANVSEEAENAHTDREIWEATLTTFISKFLFAMTFMIPVLAFELSTAINIGVVWGLFMLAILSYTIAKEDRQNSWKVIAEHLSIALIVVLATHYIGDLISEIYS